MSEPFGPQDSSTLDAAAVQQQLDATRQSLLAAQMKLTRMRYGPGPDDRDPPLRPVTRADGQWPFLLIRSFPGDVGSRPIVPPAGVSPADYAGFSPDIIVTPAGAVTGPVLDRSGIAALKAHSVLGVDEGSSLDVWVHVWNLGQAQASGVRVRVRFFHPKGGGARGTFVGGTTLDLGHRESERAHLAVKAGTFTPPGLGFAYTMTVLAVADCLSDPASDAIVPTDRHVAILRNVRLDLISPHPPLPHRPRRP